MAPIVLRAVAQTKFSVVSKPSKASAVHSVPVKGKGARLALAFLTNAGAAKLALADELALPDVSLPSIDTSAASDIASLFSDNPLLVGGGLFLVALPFGIAAIFNAGRGGSGPKATSVERTLQALAEDPRVMLVDIRTRAEVKEQGSPDLRSVKRSAVSLPYASIIKGEVVVDKAFGEKFSKLRGINEESLVILLDSDGSVAKSVAAVIEGVEKLYFVQGGAEAWAESGPWRAPSAGFTLPSLPSLDLKSVGKSVNELADDFKQAPTLTKAGLAGAALLGAGVLLVNEIEVLLEVAGLLAAGNFFFKMIFADEREKTLTEIRTLVDEKVAIQEVGSDLNKIAKAVLETDATTEPAEAEPVATVVATATESDKPQNVKEAKEWIDNWKAKTA